MATRTLPWRKLIEPGSHWSWLSVVLYAAACMLPAMPPIFGETPIPGWVCVTIMAYTFPPWWANPAYYLSLILYCARRRRAAAIFATIAALLACSFELMAVHEDGVNAIAEQEIGCYLWISSLQLHAINLLWQEWLEWRRCRDLSDRGLKDSQQQIETNAAAH